MARRVRKPRAARLQHREPRGLRGLWLVGLSLALSSCGAQWHLKRAIAKDPDIVKDKVVRVDTTIITQSVELHDTITIKEVDTVQIVKNGVVVDIQRVHDTILVDVQCPPDTVRITQEVVVPQYIPEKKSKNIGLGAVLGFIFAVVLIGTVLRMLGR